ncbi:hypothetical protein GCM10027361_21020 [Erwinia aphidicola]
MGYPQNEAKRPPGGYSERKGQATDGGGLYLLVNPNGAKYWRQKYRAAGKEKLLAIGIYPEVTLADARK